MILQQALRIMLTVGALSVANAQAQQTQPDIALPVLPTNSLPPSTPAAAPSGVTPPSAASSNASGANSAVGPNVTAPAAGGQGTQINQGLSAILGASAADGAALPAEPIKTYSYGKFPTSLLFTPDQMTLMKQALETGESKPAAVAEAAKTESIKPDAAPVAVVDPASYPVFYLSSIVYRAPGDWAVWVSGHKITPKKNDTDIKVMSISATQATLSWTPSFQQALAQRRAQKAFASTAPVKNRLVAGDPWRFDEETGTAIFTLRPNQAFAAGYMAVFEGYIESPTLPAVASASKPGAAAAATSTGPAAPPGPAANVAAGFGQDAVNRMAAQAETLSPTPSFTIQPAQPGVTASQPMPR